MLRLTSLTLATQGTSKGNMRRVAVNTPPSALRSAEPDAHNFCARHQQRAETTATCLTRGTFSGSGASKELICAKTWWCEAVRAASYCRCWRAREWSILTGRHSALMAGKCDRRSKRARCATTVLVSLGVGGGVSNERGSSEVIHPEQREVIGSSEVDLGSMSGGKQRRANPREHGNAESVCVGNSNGQVGRRAELCQKDEVDVGRSQPPNPGRPPTPWQM